MSAANPFASAGRWYRACLHAHTTNSDGLMTPESLVRHYKTGGFDVLAITDHWNVTDASARSTDEFLVLPGIEYNARGPGVGRLRFFHIVGIGVHEVRAAANAPSDFVSAIHDDGGVAIVAHPSWSGLEGTDVLAATEADAVEVWNAGCELEVARGDSSIQWDSALARGAALGGVAADDSHYPGFDSARSWVALRLGALTTDEVLVALKQRRYYSSTGPILREVEVDDDTVRVVCSPAKSIHVLGPPVMGSGLVAGTMGLTHRAERRRHDDGWAEGTLDDDGLTGGTFQVAHASYFRVVVEDLAGRRAWSNPLWRTTDGWSPNPQKT